MPVPAVFGISNSGINLAIDLVILFLVVIWLALIYWTYADARRRVADPMLVGCATATSLFPYVGTLVYMIVRPPEYLDDVRERELEMQAAEARLAELGYHLCPHCDYEVEREFLRCPNCLRKLKDPCPVCSRPLDPAWKICPFCEADLGSAPPPRRARRRREGALDRPAVSGGGFSDRPVASGGGFPESPVASDGGFSERPVTSDGGFSESPVASGNGEGSVTGATGFADGTSTPAPAEPRRPAST